MTSASTRLVDLFASAVMTVQLVTDALVMAIWTTGKPDAPAPHRPAVFVTDDH